MPKPLCLVVCQTYRAEVAAVLQRTGWPNVTVHTHPAFCQHAGVQPDATPRLPQIGAACSQVCLLTACLPARALAESHPGWQHLDLAQCFYLVAAPEWVDQLLNAGGYLVTPGWLQRWPQRLAKWGFEAAALRAFFQESARQVVLLDTGLSSESQAQVQALADYVGLAAQVWSVGLSYLEARLKALYLEWQSTQARAEIDRQTADYVLAFDWLPRLAALRTEDQVAEDLTQFCTLLFAPRQVSYLPVHAGLAGLPYRALAPVTPADSLQAWLPAAEPSTWTPDGNGFLWRLTSQNETVGLVEIDGLMFPAFRDHYLRLALALAPVVGLAVTNARTYQTLHSLNLELEQRVTARTAELSQANRDLMHALRVKDEFLAAMSHELRTPLAGVLGLADTLALGIYGPLTDRQLKPLALLRASGQRLQNLVTDVLEYAALEDGLQLTLADVPVDEACRASLAAVQADANARAIRLTYHGDPLVRTVRAERPRFESMLIKLLDNAIKFTPEGGAAGLDVTGDSLRQEMHLVVWDTGIGIAPEDQARIFEPFVQVDRRLARQYEGQGLGLTLTRRLAELHGGQARAESAGPGQGSRFTITLPWQPAAALPR